MCVCVYVQVSICVCVLFGDCNSKNRQSYQILSVILFLLQCFTQPRVLQYNLQVSMIFPGHSFVTPNLRSTASH